MKAVLAFAVALCWLRRPWPPTPWTFTSSILREASRWSWSRPPARRCSSMAASEPGRPGHEADRRGRGPREIKQFDYVLVTHYDGDHVGNIPHVDSLIPAKVFIDHGEPIPTLECRQQAEQLRALREGHRRPQADLGQAGRRAPFDGTEDHGPHGRDEGDHQSAPWRRPGQRTRSSCAPTYRDTDDNAGCVGLLYEFGKFRMVDCADLLSWVEYDLMCPRNPVGDGGPLHGQPSRPAYVEREVLRASPASASGHHEQRAPQGRRPRGAGHREGSPGLEDLWQLHYSPKGGDAKNAPKDFWQYHDRARESRSTWSSSATVPSP